MLYLVAIYFGVATLALALLALPQARALALVWARRLITDSAATHRRVAARSQQQASDALNGMGSATRAGRNWVSQRRQWLLAGAALLVAGPLIAVALALRGFLSLDGYDHRLSRSVNDQVAMLLRGEQLVPPAASPPELFITPEIERAIPMIRIASRQWDLLDGDFRQRMLVVFKGVLIREPRTKGSLHPHRVAKQLLPNGTISCMNQSRVPKSATDKSSRNCFGLKYIFPLGVIAVLSATAQTFRWRPRGSWWPIRSVGAAASRA